jgi:uncharacterized protein (TIGR02145 family)
MLMLVMTGAASVNAQVLIGGTASDEPHGGAILDLASGGQNNLGMLLPSVELNDDATVFVLVPEGTETGDTKQTATGMIVYNTATLPYGGRGVYVWGGSKWAPIVDPCPSPVNDPDGNKYSTGWFGKAGCWMTENLRYAPKAADGYSENDVLANNGEKYYTYPGTGSDASARKDKWTSVHGLLYNWYAATGRPNINADEGNTEYGPNHAFYQGICPTGWHIPSDKEWSDLEKVIAADTWSELYRTATDWRGEHGVKMKSRTYVSGVAPKGISDSAANGGFDALLVGFVYNKNSNGFGGWTYFWSSSPGANNAWARHLSSDDDPVIRINNLRSDMFSVRCKKDN